jgi:hypothetical protein
MSHWCRICGRTRPNEKFSGKGHKNHICKECSRKPKEELYKIDQSVEIFNYLEQSNISKKNIVRLEKLAGSQNQEISELAKIVLEVARIKPHKRRRLRFLARENRQLLSKLESSGMVMAHYR